MSSKLQGNTSQFCLKIDVTEDLSSNLRIQLIDSEGGGISSWNSIARRADGNFSFFTTKFDAHLANSSQTLMFNSSRMANVKDITGSKFDDYILGNSLPNEIVCDSGHDVIRGAGGTDMYIISEDCKAAIDNFDLGLDIDLLFVEKFCKCVLKRTV